MMDYKLLADTAMLAGEIMLRSGAETSRVEDTMNHILKTSNLESKEAISVMTGIFLTLNDERMEQPVTLMRKVEERSINMSNIIYVNDISRRYCAGEIGLEEAHKELQNVKGKQYRRRIYNIATIGISVGFAMMFGGSIFDVVAAAIVGAVLAGIVTLGKMTNINSVLVNVLSGIGITILAVIVRKFLFEQIATDIVIISAIMPIVPGVAITNAIRDTLHGDYLSGCARILEALLVAIAIAVGAGLGMLLVGGLL